MFLRFKANWKYAEKGIYMRHYESGKQYRESDKCSDSEIDGEGASLALDLGVAEKVDDHIDTSQTPKEKDGYVDISNKDTMTLSKDSTQGKEVTGKKPQSSGQSRRSGKGKRSR